MVENTILLLFLSNFYFIFNKEVIEMMLKYEVRCPRCKSLWLKIISADRVYNSDYSKELGNYVIYKCDDCNNIFCIAKVGNKTASVFEISLNNS